MNLNFLKSKIHRATVTHSNLDYEGSIAIDEELMEISNIKEFEQVDVYNINNGERLTTYAIKGERGSGVIGVQGAAAHKATDGDLIIICAYCQISEEEAKSFRPMKVLVDGNNKVVREI